MKFFTRIDDDNIRWYYIAPDDYVLEPDDRLISYYEFYTHIRPYCRQVGLTEECSIIVSDKKMIH